MSDPGSRIPFFFSDRRVHEHDHEQHHGVPQEDHKGAHLAPQTEPHGHSAPRSVSPDPIFEKHAEATNIELFYDLFFVANLTVFSTVKEVNDGQTLTQYIGFFCILWFTWYQVSLYDVRFSKDSMFDRMAKLVQFGVMIGFAACGPTFNAGVNTGKQLEQFEVFFTAFYDPSYRTFRALTLIMMVSRFVLVLQYIQAMLIFRSRNIYQHNVLPMALIAATELVASLMYGLLYLAFQHGDNNAYIAWYIIAVAETLTSTAIASIYRKEISFKGTHLVQRMGLLTLIILGEGIMGLAERCQTLVKNQIFPFYGTTISDITFSLMIINFLYMLYFDWVQEHHHMGTIKQPIWAFLHFPLHLALVLAVEGASQFIAWRAGIAKIYQLINSASEHASSDTSVTDVANFMNDMANNVFQGALAGAKNSDQTNSYNTNWNNITTYITKFNTTGDFDDVETAFGYIMNTVLTAVGFEPPLEVDSNTSGSPLEQQQEEFDRIASIAFLVYYYFFITIGAYVILTGVLAWLSKRDKNLAGRTRLIVSFVIGGILCLLTLIEVNDATSNFIFTPYVLPLVGILLLIVVVLNHAPLPRNKEELHKIRGRSTKRAGSMDA